MNNLEPVKDQGITLIDLIRDLEPVNLNQSINYENCHKRLRAFSECINMDEASSIGRNAAESDEITLRCTLFEPPKEFNVCISLCEYPSKGQVVMIVLNDISEKIILKASKISEKVKTIMFCSISHELRSPLNHISGMHSLLKSKLATQEQQDLMQIAESSTELLRIKIDDILDYYEVETSNFTTQKMQFDIRNQCKELETVFSPLVNKRRVKLLFYVNEQTPKLMTHDACRIHKILINLISNSVKYTK